MKFIIAGRVFSSGHRHIIGLLILQSGSIDVRRPFIAGNWKMNLNGQEASALADGIKAGATDFPGIDIAICPPAVYLDAVGQRIAGTAVGLGAQNVYHERAGAFTGETSPTMASDLGCRYIILGHSERRHVFGESDQDVNLKVLATLEEGMTPILCLGELLEQREAGKTLAVIQQQFDGSLAGLEPAQAAKIVIAYEPVWAIGTGKVATPAQAEEVHADLRRMLESRYNSQVAADVRIQYGGSVKPDNAAELLSQPNIDGALVGGAALDAVSFLKIVAAAAKHESR